MKQTPSVPQQLKVNVGLRGSELRKRAQNADTRAAVESSSWPLHNEDAFRPVGTDEDDEDADWLKADMEQPLLECEPLLLAKSMHAAANSNSEILPPTRAELSAALALATAQQPNRSQRTSRRFSESSADELHRSGAAVKRAGWNREMWQNELIVNSRSSTPQPQRKSGCCCANGAGDGDGGAGGGSCCCSRDNVNENRISDAIDVGIRVALVIIFCILEMANSFKRKIHKEEIWLYMNPRTPDIVTPVTLLLSVIFGPLLVTLVHLQLTGDRRDFRAASWVWTLALGLNGLVTSLLKITVGRHRPDFFYRCFPDGVAVFNNVTDPSGRADMFSCTGNVQDINEGRKSFPSGHASFSFVGFGFIAIYIGAKLHALSPRGRGQSWRLFITVQPLILAALIAVSRTCDYHHHWEDVVAGSCIGFVVIYLVYRQYYPSVFSHNCHRPYLRGSRIGTATNVRRQHQNDYRRLSNAAGELEAFDGEEYESASKDERRPLIYDG